MEQVFIKEEPTDLDNQNESAGDEVQTHFEEITLKYEPLFQSPEKPSTCKENLNKHDCLVEFPDAGKHALIEEVLIKHEPQIHNTEELFNNESHTPCEEDNDPTNISEGCGCSHSCSKLLVHERYLLRGHYNELADWDAKSNYLASCIKVVPVADHHNTSEEMRIAKSVQYHINGKRVCKNTLTSVLGISLSRLDYIERKKVYRSTEVNVDKRKCHFASLREPHDVKRARSDSSTNVPHNTAVDISNFFYSFPKYKSNDPQNSKLYYGPHLDKHKLFQIFYESNPEIQISKYSLGNELEKINISFCGRESCKRCTEYIATTHSFMQLNLKDEYDDSDHKNHLHSAKAAQNKLKLAEEHAKSNSGLFCFTFDFGKTQCVPYLPHSAALCKRQLWLYTFGINTRHNNKEYIFNWTETEGRRGMMEMVSCIHHFLSKQKLDKIKELHTFSRCCVEKATDETLLFYITYASKLFSITWRHTFMENGHAFLPNESNFDKIDKVKNSERYGIFNTEDWMHIISANFKVKATHMKDQLFDFSQLSSWYNIGGSKLDWMKLKEFILVANSNAIRYTYSHATDAKWHESNIIKCTHETKLQPLLLYPSGLKISKAKYIDILSILKYLPPIVAEVLVDVPHEEQDTSEEIETLPDFI